MENSYFCGGKTYVCLVIVGLLFGLLLGYNHPPLMSHVLLGQRDTGQRCDSGRVFTSCLVQASFDLSFRLETSGAPHARRLLRL